MMNPEWVFPKTCGSCLKLSARVAELEAKLYAKQTEMNNVMDMFFKEQAEYYVNKEKYDALLANVRALVDAGNHMKSEIQENSAKWGISFPCVLIDDWDKAIAALRKEVDGGKD